MGTHARDGSVRVLLCDDALGFPELVSSWLADAPDVELVGHTGNATELLDMLPGTTPDVVLLDLMLPEGQTGPELVAEVRNAVPGARVILVSSLPEPQLAFEVERTGADGYCPKATTADALRAAVLAQR
jgi:DNA-binding NarL/FixJ family response regulator